MAPCSIESEILRELNEMNQIIYVYIYQYMQYIYTHIKGSKEGKKRKRSCVAFFITKWYPHAIRGEEFFF